MSWINDLDALSAAGVISFDAPSYIRGTQPRYVGNPPLGSVPDQLIPVKQQPAKDEFEKSATGTYPSRWKKILFTTLAAAGLVFGGYKIAQKTGLLSKLGAIKTLPSKIWSKLKAFVK